MASHLQPIPPQALTELHITFGVEMEFVFAARKQAIEEFLMDSSKNVQSDNESFLAHILQRTDMPPPPRPGEPSRPTQPLGHVDRSNEPHNHSYANWTITTDCSIRASLRHAALALGKTRAEIDAAAETTWYPMLKHIQHNLSSSADFKPIHNSSCGLHLHFGFRENDIPLRTVQTLFIIWAICEEEINRLYSAERVAPYDFFARSLRTRCGPRYSHLGFARDIYATKSMKEILMWTGAELCECGCVDERHSKITISAARHNKDMTLEFREHRGTADVEEIYWWQRFCHGVLKFSHGTPLKIDSDGIVQELKENLLTLVAGLDDSGVRFFTAKVAEYDLQKEKIAKGLLSSYPLDELEESEGRRDGKNQSGN